MRKFYAKQLVYLSDTYFFFLWLLTLTLFWGVCRWGDFLTGN